MKESVKGRQTTDCKEGRHTDSQLAVRKTGRPVVRQTACSQKDRQNCSQVSQTDRPVVRQTDRQPAETDRTVVRSDRQTDL